MGKGYGQFFIEVGRPLEGAHRVAWMLTHGPIPDGLWVLHHCDNPPCCNAERHHYLGTGVDNVRDTIQRGRFVVGDRLRGRDHPLAKITVEDVRLIRSMAAAGESQRIVGLRFGISQSMVSQIVLNKLWQHV
jgi:hypothetical protein